ncbi:related to KRE6-glucan synthase subunit [Sporisorium reilianum f. sp. reilianum]|uniref:Related to KRE6-glucan synthase subunit n=1 Tax=Sporisorium reilianum f. sp. reilianum TaxID=72559 RepID=A0A2N8UEW9_9BASI|nr:related to KRE6-glucan synthase subunit [Sporisorium reilianum f. sp. reilianum]
MATQDAFQQDAQRAREDGLRLATDPAALQPPAMATSELLLDSASASPPTRSAHLSPSQPPQGISPGQRGVPNPKPYSNTSPASSSSEVHRKLNQAQAIAWLYDYTGGPEDDDWLHVPGVERKRSIASCLLGWCNVSVRGVFNVGVLLLLSLALLMLFAGYPILYHFFVMNHDKKAPSFYGLGGTNGSGQVPLLTNLFSLVDVDTPSGAHAWKNPTDGSTYHIVFSDEFEQDGRTFWPGDDPFWEAIDLHYWVTGDFEWYSPEAINTTGGFLNVWLQEKETHNLNFQSGMLQSWNKFCFQGGYIETSVILPGAHDNEGFWPAVWMLGNLGRAGYAGTTQGMWPYSYSACDIGTLPNQTNPAKTGPDAALNAHGLYSKDVGNKISFLEGQRCSACTCPGEDHPGPNHSVGRSSPEIDVFEVQVQNGHGEASQSFQIAPFDANYTWNQSPSVATLHSADSQFNTYTGGVYQEAVSAVTKVPDTAYAQSGGVPVKMGVQYEPDWQGDGSGSITWFVNGQPTWTLSGASLAANPYTEIGQRLIPTEPMSIVINLALSDGFQKVHWNQIDFPAVMRVDYIRVYQKDGEPDRISCDPPDHPTAKYINDHMDILTPCILLCSLLVAQNSWPKSSLLGQC